MAVRAGRDLPLRKLLSVDIFVAVLAFRGGSLEINIKKFGFKVRGLVAIHAGCGSVGSQQGERCLRMVESR